MAINHGIKRQRCENCQHPLCTCLCGLVQPVLNQVELIILQHPLEAKQAKNTAQLLHLCLNNSQLYIGETFSSAFFTERQSRPSESTQGPIYDLLLYPETPEEKSQGIPSPPPLDNQQLQLATAPNLAGNTANISTLRLWVLDATWRKSRKMLYLNRELQVMPRLPLQQVPASLYSIRKAHSKNQLSTLEASCYALRQLEHNRVDYAPVLTAFAAFIARHNTFIPSH